MVQLTTRERVDAFWSTTLNVEISALHAPGVRLYSNPPDREHWRGIYVLAFGDSACVFAPADILGHLAAVVRLDARAVLDPATWTPLLGETVRASLGPLVHHYLDNVAGLGELAAGRRINPADASALSSFRGSIAKHEWVAAGFAAAPAMLFGIFEGEHIIAAANLTAGPDAATDVGIAIHPDARGRGYGIKVAATAARQALLMHGVARFRANSGSAATMAIAAKLGFTEYGRNLTLYLATPPPS